ncbi:MAG: hypothetical protein GY720_15770 [bacterium]|nr:hypothetical protein [bacterium]
MTCDVDAARTFIYANARLLEQRVYAATAEGGDPAAVVAALAAYQNDDGGFGNGLEPDKRAPASQPLDVEIAFERLAMVGANAPDLVTSACDWLTTVAAPSGAVPILLPSVAGYPRADHWESTEYAPGLNPTAGIVAHVHALGVAHPWVDLATEYCFAEVEAGRGPHEAHVLLGLSKLVDTAPDRHRAEQDAELLASALPGAGFMRLDPKADTYGVTPLDFASTPTSLARSWFDDDVVEAHLDSLEREQQDDGGWPISWKPPSDASRCEWRAIRTILALRVLSAYGCLPR